MNFGLAFIQLNFSLFIFILNFSKFNYANKKEMGTLSGWASQDVTKVPGKLKNVHDNFNSISRQ
jgi:hypothetical protein